MGVSHLISIVGAGPGDPELLTIKALDRLKKADVILYDALTGNDILELAQPDSIKIYVGKLYKDGQDQMTRQNEIHSNFIKYARQNLKIVRLKSGDPMIFGRGAEEIRFCRENNLNYEVVPGVTAGLAASANFDISLTERGKSGMVLFCAGYRSKDYLTNPDPMVQVLLSGSPVVIYMGINILSQLSSVLISNSVDSSTPVQILSRISLSNQKKYSTTLASVTAFLEKANPESPSIVIIGKYAESV